jgi:hypothetical protein
MWKNILVGQATDDNMTHAHCMLDNYGYTYTHKICNTYCFSNATIVRTRFNVAFIRTLPILFCCISTYQQSLCHALYKCSPCLGEKKNTNIMYHITVRYPCDRRKIDTKFWWGGLKEVDHLEDHQGVEIPQLPVQFKI